MATTGEKTHNSWLHQHHQDLSSTMNINLNPFMTALHRTTLPSHTLFEEQRVIVVGIAIVEVQALLSLHEPLFHQRDEVPQRRRMNNIAIDLLHEEIVKWETW